VLTHHFIGNIVFYLNINCDIVLMLAD